MTKTCARHCEANAFQIEIRELKAQLAKKPVEPVAWLELVTLSSGSCGEAFQEWRVTQNPATSDVPRRPLYLHPAPPYAPCAPKEKHHD